MTNAEFLAELETLAVSVDGLRTLAAGRDLTTNEKVFLSTKLLRVAELAARDVARQTRSEAVDTAANGIKRASLTLSRTLEQLKHEAK